MTHVLDVNGDGQPDLDTGESAGLEPVMQPRSMPGPWAVHLRGPECRQRAIRVGYGSSGTVGSTKSDYAFFDVNDDGVLDLLLSRYWESYIDYEAGLLWSLDGPINRP